MAKIHFEARTDHLARIAAARAIGFSPAWAGIQKEADPSFNARMENIVRKIGHFGKPLDTYLKRP